MLARISIIQSRRGNTAIWHTALSRYPRNTQSREIVQDTSSFYRGSSIFGFDRTNGQQKDLSITSRDWFAPAEPIILSSGTVEGHRDSASGSFSSVGRAGTGAYGNGAQSAVPLQQQFQSPGLTRDPGVTKTIDGFEIVSDGYYFQQEGSWGQGTPQRR